MKRHLVFATVVVMTVMASGVLGQTTDPWLGTWKVNPAKSTFSPGPAATGTLKTEQSQGGFKTTIDVVQGQPIHTETSWKFDGKDNPVQGAAVPNSTSSYKRINGRSFDVISKVNGKVTITTRVAVSADGKTLTATQTGKDAQGQTVKNVIVLDKQ